MSKAAQIAYDRAVENAKLHCGKTVNLMLAVLGGDYAEVVGQLIRPGIPGRIEPFSYHVRQDPLMLDRQLGEGRRMTLYKRKDSPYYRVKFAPIKGELKPFMQSTGTANKRQAQQYHDKLQNERWEQDRLGVKPRRTWGEAAAKFLQETAAQANPRVGQVDAAMVQTTSRSLGGRRN